MDPFFVILIIVVAVPAAFLLFRRGTKIEQSGRPDDLEPRELTGDEQHKRRKQL